MANLTILHGKDVKMYPPWFEQGAWNNEVPTVTSADADSIREIFEGLRQVLCTKSGRRVRLAMHRLNLSALRTNDEDGIIDAMIAVKALLSSDSREELSHKVAMRLAGLYKVLGKANTEQVFREMKYIYAFRSKVVHGDAAAEKYREMSRDGAKVSSLDVAVEHLRMAFATLLRNPALLDPTKIDTFLLNDRGRRVETGSKPLLAEKIGRGYLR